MFPCSHGHYIANGDWTNSKLFTNPFSTVMRNQLSYLANILLLKFRVSLGFASRCVRSSFENSISGVVFMASEKQMIGSHARRDIASVKNAHSFFNRTVEERPYKPCCQLEASTCRHHSIASMIRVRRPKPAGFSLLSVGHKSIKQWFLPVWINSLGPYATGIVRAALRVALKIIPLPCAKHEMVRIDASGYIAGVAKAKPRGDFTFENQPCKPMGTNRSLRLLKIEESVSTPVRSCFPKPATSVCFLDFCPKSFLVLDGWNHDLVFN